MVDLGVGESSAPHALILGCGDLGSRAAGLLRVDGFRVTGVRRRSFALPGCQTMALDLANPDALRCLPPAVDLVVVALTPALRTPDAYRACYVDLPAAAARYVNAPRWIFVSSTAVYGEQQSGAEDGWIDDFIDAQPSRFNGEILLEAEHSLRSQVSHLTALRCSGLYGPGRRMLWDRARRGEFGDPRWTHRIHIDDAARALCWCAGHADPPAQVIATDPCPALECDVLRDLAALQRGEPISDVNLSVRASGRRLRPRILLDAGFEWHYPSYREGYRALFSVFSDSPQAPLAL